MRAVIFSCVLLAVAACGGAPETASSEAASRPLPAIPRDTYQIDLPRSELMAGDVTGFVSDGKFGYVLTRCIDTPCTAVETLKGQYKLARVSSGRTMTLLDQSASLVVEKYFYSTSSGTLVLDGPSTASALALDPVREDLCDATNGKWRDDDASMGLYCECGALGWSSAGCQ